ncbi:MAG: replicative DNA helicase [Planctomycetota bacterium]|nr:replicative DNA helicase [Planctomycetota bacterium]
MNEASRSERTPPQNIEAEMCVLGSILLDNAAYDMALPHLSEESFYRAPHREIFEAIRELRDRNQPVDLVTLKEELDRRGRLEEVGGGDYLLSVAESVPSAANAEYYARIVREKHLGRQLIQASNEILREAFDGGDDAEKMLADAESRIFEIGQKGMSQEAQRISTILNFDMIEELQDPSRRISGIRTGFDDLDAKTNGFEPSQLIIVAGRPSMGKTTLVNNILLHAAVEEKRPVGFFSLETSARQIGVNLLGAHARVDAHKMRQGFLSREEWQHLWKIASGLIEAPIFVDDSPNLSIRELRAKARRLRSREKVEIIAVDYLQQIEGYQKENRQQEISMISRSLKAMARELEVPVVCVSQLSRAVESREGNRPKLSDLRESGSIEQDADIVLLLYRKEYYQPENDEHKRRAELIIAKQRNGPTGTIPLHFRSEYLRFENYSSLEGPSS